MFVRLRCSVEFVFVFFEVCFTDRTNSTQHLVFFFVRESKNITKRNIKLMQLPFGGDFEVTVQNWSRFGCLSFDHSFSTGTRMQFSG